MTLGYGRLGGFSREEYELLMPDRLCCVKCFQSPNLRRFIEEAGTTGDCDFCEAEDVAVISPRELAEPMDELIGFYHPAEADQDYAREGNRDAMDFPSLAEVMQDDWSFFNGNFGYEVWDELLDEIRGVGRQRPDDGCYLQESAMGWSSNCDRIYEESGEDLWSEFADQIKRERRFIFTGRFADQERRPETWITQAVTDLGAVHELAVGERLYRARKGVTEPSRENGWLRQPFPASQMGAPPAHLATAARANSLGIPMFYAAFERDTAVVEAGRFPGTEVSVRRVTPVKRLRMVDLMQLRSVPDPIGVTNLESVLWKNGLLNRLNEELSRPIHPDDSAIEYLPTQYLAEAIRDTGFDGILYQSAMQQEGRNAVIFDPDDMRVSEDGAEIVRIRSVSFELVKTEPRRQRRRTIQEAMEE